MFCTATGRMSGHALVDLSSLRKSRRSARPSSRSFIYDSDKPQMNTDKHRWSRSLRTICVHLWFPSRGAGLGHPVTADLSAALRRTRDTLAPVRERFPAAALAFDLLERDLLPRSAGGDAYLIVGIVGPNNAGKSALFNALVGRSLSP